MMLPSLLHHDAPERLEEIDGPLEVEGDDAIKVLLGVVENRLADIQSRRGDGDVDAWMPGLDQVSQALDRRRAGGVGDDSLGRPASFTNSRRRSLGAAAVAIRANDSRAQIGQGLG